MRSIMIGSEEVVLDTDDLEFNEATIGDFQERLAVKYDYFGQKLADLEFIKDRLDMELDEIYSRIYLEHKDDGCTEKQAEARAKSDIAFVEKKKEVLEAKKNVKLLQQHMRSWDRAHDNATSRGHTLRKEMDKLNVDFGTRHKLGEEASKIVGGNS